MSARVDVVVIGAGSNGLAAAAVLAKAGKRVLVLESAERAGGQARLEQFAPGFHTSLGVFDSGWVSPSVVRATGVRVPAQQAPAVGVSVALPGAGRDDELFSIPASAARAMEVISRHSADDARKWSAFTRLLREQANVLAQLYRLPAPQIDMTSARKLLPLIGVAGGLRMRGADGIIDLLRTLPLSATNLLSQWFTSEPLKAAVAAGAVQGIRQGPRSGGTSFVLLHHLIGAEDDSVRSRPFFQTGPDAWAVALQQAAQTHGANVQTAATVRRILVDDYHVKGVLLESGEEITCTHVVSSADPVHTVLELVEPEWLDPDLRHSVGNIKLRGCTAFLSYALATLPPLLSPEQNGDAARSVISLTPTEERLERAYDAIKYNELAGAPHIEVAVPSVRWPHVAPAGEHVIVARVHYVPSGTSAETLAARSDAAIEAAFPGFLARVLHRAVLTPADLAREYGATAGSLSHGEMTLDQILFMRPVPALSQYRTPIHGLFLGGSGCHPGPGVPGGAGVLAAKALLNAE